MKNNVHTLTDTHTNVTNTTKTFTLQVKTDIKTNVNAKQIIEKIPRARIPYDRIESSEHTHNEQTNIGEGKLTSKREKQNMKRQRQQHLRRREKKNGKKHLKKINSNTRSTR